MRAGHSSSTRRLSRFVPATLLAALIMGGFGQEVLAEPFSEVSIILETNATDCDTGVQLFFDGDRWREVKVTDPNGTTILQSIAQGPLSRFGLTEQFNESNEPVMRELVQGFPELECDKPEFSLARLFNLFPQGRYRFQGTTVDGVTLESVARLSHVIPAPPQILWPANIPLSPEHTEIIWQRVDEPILPGFGRGASDDVDIIGFQVIVDREEVGGEPAPLLVFTADLGRNDRKVRVPPQFLQRNAKYKFEVMQIDRSGNQTIAESEFETIE